VPSLPLPVATFALGQRSLDRNVMPARFASGDKLIGNPIIATFGAFGSFALLLLV
jgi:hypothetical protein